VRRLPRLALLLLCIAYVIPGFIGREPWKHADITSFGYMLELARGSTEWLAPKMLGLDPAVDAWLPYWLGAWAVQMAPSWIAPDFAARIPFGFLLAFALSSTWYGTYYLARSPEAQPVAFAFGGEASPTDYARALADAGLLAFIACLGLAQLSHETTPALAQLCFSTLTFSALAALAYRPLTCAVIGSIGLIGLALSGAPSMAAMLGVGGSLIHLLDKSTAIASTRHKYRLAAGIALVTICVVLISTFLGLWRWRIELPQADWMEWRSLGRLFLWFTWPAWPLALWTLWQWRRQLVRGYIPSLHLSLPLCFTAVAIGATLTTASNDRSLLMSLPALAALAAFSLPTLKRSVAALVDWFTLIFFSGCASIIWIIWVAMQTGFPARPASNVARLVPGFEPSFSFPLFIIALAATSAWAWLVVWRVGRHRAAIWKSLVLPAGGATLCWLLLMTLWLPLLDFARSNAPLVRRTLVVMKQQPPCVVTHGLSRSQIAAFTFHGKLIMKTTDKGNTCPWLIVDKDAIATLPGIVNSSDWVPHNAIRHPADRNEDLFIYRRVISSETLRP
jgi:hypothetical protein